MPATGRRSPCRSAIAALSIGSSLCRQSRGEPTVEPDIALLCRLQVRARQLMSAAKRGTALPGRHGVRHGRACSRLADQRRGEGGAAVGQHIRDVRAAAMLGHQVGPQKGLAEQRRQQAHQRRSMRKATEPAKRRPYRPAIAALRERPGASRLPARRRPCSVPRRYAASVRQDDRHSGSPDRCTRYWRASAARAWRVPGRAPGPE